MALAVTEPEPVEAAATADSPPAPAPAPVAAAAPAEKATLPLIPLGVGAVLVAALVAFNTMGGGGSVQVAELSQPEAVVAQID